MIIPEFKTKTIPVYDMDYYLNMPTEEAKTFKGILIAIKDYKLFLKATEVASLLDYEEKALKEVFSILVEMGLMPDVDYDYYSLKEEFNSINEYEAFKEAPVKEIKYYAVKQLIEELDLIHSILIELKNNLSDFETVYIANIHDLKKGLEE